MLASEAKASESVINPRFRSLLYAGQLDLFLTSDAEAVGGLIRELYSELQKAGHITTTRHRERRYRHLLAITLNLYSAHQIHANRYVVCPMARNFYSQSNRYAARWASHDMTRQLISGLKSLGYLKLEPGFYDRSRNRGYRTRVRATKRLCHLFKDRAIEPQMVTRSPDFELIRLKDKEKKLVDYADSDETIAMRQRLEAMNARIAQAFIGLHIRDAELTEVQRRAVTDPTDPEYDWEERYPIDLTSTRLYRVFNDGSFELGGRFYGGWWQSVPSQFRKHIYTCHGHNTYPKYTVEIDYSSMQPSLVYAEEGMDPPEDAYAVPWESKVRQRILRPLLKAAMLRMLNTASPIEAAESLDRYIRNEQRKLPEGYPDAESIISLMEQVHKPIRAHLYTCIGKRLMFLESQIAEKVIERMWNQDSLVLPIHDSFLVQRGHRWALESIMRKVFEETTGRRCHLKLDETEYEYDARVSGAIERAERGERNRFDRSSLVDSAPRREYGQFWDSFVMWLETKCLDESYRSVPT